MPESRAWTRLEERFTSMLASDSWLLAFYLFPPACSVPFRQDVMMTLYRRMRQSYDTGWMTRGMDFGDWHGR